MTNIRSRSPADNMGRGITATSSWLNAISTASRESGRPQGFVSETSSGQGWSTAERFQKECEVSYQLQKSTLSWLSNGTLVLWVSLVLKAGHASSTWHPKHVKTNTENNVRRGDHHHYVSGGHTVTFSYLLMAEIVSSLFPLPQYITLFTVS